MRPAAGATPGTQTIYGLHAVRAMLERHPQRVLGVRLAQHRADARTMLSRSSPSATASR